MIVRLGVFEDTRVHSISHVDYKRIEVSRVAHILSTSGQGPWTSNLHNAHPRSVCFVSWSKVWLSISHEMHLWNDLPTSVVLYSLSMQVMSLLLVSDEAPFLEQTAVQLDPGTT